MESDSVLAVIVEIEQQQPAVSGDPPTRRVRLDTSNRFEATVGRASKENPVYGARDTSAFFAVHSVSREHAKLVYKNGQLSYLDNGSKNGSKVNGCVALPGAPVELAENDQIVLALNKSGLEPLVLRLARISVLDSNDSDESTDSVHAVDSSFNRLSEKEVTAPDTSESSETETCPGSARKRKRSVSSDDEAEAAPNKTEAAPSKNESAPNKTEAETAPSKTEAPSKARKIHPEDTPRKHEKAREAKDAPRNWLSILGTLTTGAVIGGVATFAALASSTT